MGFRSTVLGGECFGLQSAPDAAASGDCCNQITLFESRLFLFTTRFPFMFTSIFVFDIVSREANFVNVSVHFKHIDKKGNIC